MSSLLQTPPDERAITFRAHGLGALVQRLEYELTIQGFNELSIVEIHRGMVDDMGRWIEAEGLSNVLSDDERRLLAESLGHWSREAIDEAGWLTEPLGVLLWALGLAKTPPPYDRRTGSDDVLMHLRLGKSLQPILDKVHLRPVQQLEEAAVTAQWRERAQAGTTGQHKILARIAKERADIFAWLLGHPLPSSSS